MIRTLFESGVDVFRLNFSHGSHEDHRARFNAIRALEAEVNHPIAILQDLQGPKIRLGAVSGGKMRRPSESSARRSSFALHIIPSLSTPRSLPVLILKSPGSTAPGSASRTLSPTL
jgi:hypothetical protein